MIFFFRVLGILGIGILEYLFSKVKFLYSRFLNFVEN